jgi:hypothetical protein
MTQATIEICGAEFTAEFEFNITAHGNPGSRPSLDHPGDAPEAAEFDIEVLSLRGDAQPKDSPDLEMPAWLKATIEEHLQERDDINAIVQEADSDRERDDDPDLYRDEQRG